MRWIPSRIASWSLDRLNSITSPSLSGPLARGERTQILLHDLATRIDPQCVDGGHASDYGGEAMLRSAVGVPDSWMLAAHVVVGWPRGRHGPLRRRPVSEVVALDHWDSPAWGDDPLWDPHGI
jgi:hypothetical protein